MTENIKKDLYVQMCLNGSYLIVQHNSLITGKQSLSLNSAKILRATIMQVVKDEARQFQSGKKFKKIPWVSFCEYDDEINKFVIQLNQAMKPVLIGLKNNYTQYTLENILSMKSIYGIRIFELLQEKIKSKNKYINTNIELTIEYIRECCDCENKYIRFSQFKTRVLDRGTEEINRVTLYNITYDCVKQGRVITSIIFHVKNNF